MPYRDRFSQEGRNFVKQLRGTKAAAMAARLAVLAVLIGAVTLLDPVLLGAMSLVDSATAWGNAYVISTDSTTGATVVIAPSQDSTTFNEAPTSRAAQLTVVGTGQNQWSTGAPCPAGGDLSVAMLSPPPPGLYTVSYTVASDEGHVVSGSWRFTVANEAPAG
jgi:methionine-rich copper-binding protein CopC